MTEFQVDVFLSHSSSDWAQLASGMAEVERRLWAWEELDSVKLQCATRLFQSILLKAFIGELPRKIKPKGN